MSTRGPIQRLCTVAVLLAAPAASGAQALWEVGVKSGLARYRLTSGREFMWNQSTGSSAAFLRYSRGLGAAIQGEALTTRRLGVSVVAGTRLTMRADYVEVPLLAQWDAVSFGPLAAYLTGGPLVAFRYSCRLTFEGGGVAFDDECDAARGVQSNRFDVGGAAGAGARVAFGPLSLLGEVRASRGISTNVLPIDSTGARNAGWSAMLGASVAVSRLRRTGVAAPGTPGVAPPRPMSLGSMPVEPQRQSADAAVPLVLPEVPSAIRISVDADDVDLAEVVAGIARATNTTILLDPRVRRRVTLSLRDVTAEEAVQAIRYRTGLAMVRSVDSGRSVMELRPIATPDR